MQYVNYAFQSLAVGEGESSPGHKLVGANSVNSIITSHNAVQEESGRVAGWAVGFQRLLADPAGLTIFTVSHICWVGLFEDKMVVCLGRGYLVQRK